MLCDCKNPILEQSERVAVVIKRKLVTERTAASCTQLANWKKSLLRAKCASWDVITQFGSLVLKPGAVSKGLTLTNRELKTSLHPPVLSGCSVALLTTHSSHGLQILHTFSWEHKPLDITEYCTNKVQNLNVIRLITTLWLGATTQAN